MSAALLARLIEAGTPAELVGEVAMELARAQAVQEIVEQRRAKDRERKRVPRNSEESTESVEIQKQGSLEVPPQTPLPKPSNNSPLSPPKSGTCFPADWQVPSPSDLTPKARACAEQWTRASYETEAEGFWLHWRQSRKRRPDWTGTWAAWVIRQHSKVMRDQKFGNAPTSSTKLEKSAVELRELAEWYVRHGQRDQAEECRKKAIAQEQRQAA